jgi:hypothetical protein
VLVHGAIRPSNVYLTPQSLQLVGLCASGTPTDVFCEADRDSDESVYLAPEVVRYGYADVVADVYALGMVSAFCCTGEHPTARLIERRFDDWRIPPRLARVLEAACAQDPTKRHQSVRDLKRDLLRALEPETDEDLVSQAATDGQSRLQSALRAVGRSLAPVASDEVEVTAGGNFGLTLRTIGSMGPVYVCGCVWDVLLLQFFVVWHVLLMGSVPDSLSRSDFLLGTLFQYLFEYYIPSALIAYGLMYKEPFRLYLGPVGRVGWLTQFLACIILAALSLLVVLLMFFFGYRW